LDIKKPLEIHMGKNRYEHPCVMALVQLGIPEEKAQNKVEKIEALKGYVGKEISTLAIKQGYDAIFQYFSSSLFHLAISKQFLVLVVGPLHLWLSGLRWQNLCRAQQPDRSCPQHLVSPAPAPEWLRWRAAADIS
jgi:hypothetical protein